MLVLNFLLINFFCRNPCLNDKLTEVIVLARAFCTIIYSELTFGRFRKQRSEKENRRENKIKVKDHEEKVSDTEKELEKSRWLFSL